ncbi:Immunoglobulin-like domain [Cinara cedri]|uniref:Immunoglobulin-like domain n=1 Tax=Cinara cedri TaxID=506608 RepID=A0A5E4M5R3_9HEMI|nr:Immunoglobulin-like domain [Cinara cedri]
MAVTVLSFFLPIALFDRVLQAGSVRNHEQPTPWTIPLGSTWPDRRVSEETSDMNNNNNNSTQSADEFSPAVDLQQKHDGGYSTLSSAAIPGDDSDSFDHPWVPSTFPVYPSMTTGKPIFIPHSNHRHAEHPNIYDGRTYRPDADNSNGQRPEYPTAKENVVPIWTRYEFDLLIAYSVRVMRKCSFIDRYNNYFADQRHLKKQHHNRQVFVDPIMSTNGGGRPFVNRFQQNALDYDLADGGVDYAQVSDHQDLKDVAGIAGGEENDDGGASSWFDQLQTRPSSSTAKARRPSQEAVFDVYEIASSAVVGISQAKAFKVLKFLLFLLIKFKLFVLMKFWFIVKLFVLAKIVKIMLLPFVPSMMMAMFNNNTSLPAPTPHTCPCLLVSLPSPPGPPSDNSISTSDTSLSSMMSSSSSSRNGNASIPTVITHNRFLDFDTFGVAFVPKLARFVSTVQSAQCVQRMACNEAGSKSPNLEFVWINGVMSSLVSYIPSKKLKLYVTTFKEVSDSRQENNIYSKFTTDEWSKWCTERYSCEEETTTNVMV